MIKTRDRIQSEFFDHDKYQYDISKIASPPPHTKDELQTLLSLMSQSVGKEVADFGAGSGRVTYFLMRTGYDVTAIDISKNSLENLIKVFETNKQKKPQVSIDFPADLQFGNIVGADILHHIDLDIHLKSFYNHLKKGGKIVFSEPNAFNLAWYVILPLLSSWEVEKGLLDMRYFSLKRKLQSVGFKNIKIIGYGLFPTPVLSFFSPLYKLNLFLSNLPILKLFAYRFMVTAEK